MYAPNDQRETVFGKKVETVEPCLETVVIRSGRRMASLFGEEFRRVSIMDDMRLVIQAGVAFQVIFVECDRRGSRGCFRGRWTRLCFAGYIYQATQNQFGALNRINGRLTSNGNFLASSFPIGHHGKAQQLPLTILKVGRVFHLRREPHAHVDTEIGFAGPCDDDETSCLLEI